MVVSDAMRNLVHRRRGSIGAISGCIIRMVDARISKTLEYMQEVEASKSPWEGAAGYSLLASNTSDRGVGIYFIAGKFGYIMKVGDIEPFHKEPADTIQTFVNIARDKYGLNLEGGMPA